MEIHLNAYAAVIILVVFIIAMITIIVFRLELKKLRNIYSLRMKKVPLNDQDKVEPYVMAADVYAVPPHSGRGGWTWYTGSAGWMYKAGLESILGFQKHGNTLLLDPCIPQKWPEYTISYKYFDSIYNIKVKNPEGVNKGVKTIVEGSETREGNILELVNDGKVHDIEVLMGK